MTMLLAAAALFIAIHLLVSGTRLRDVIVGIIGEGPYRGLFSLASLGAIVWLCFAYKPAFADFANRVLFVPAAWVRADMALPLMLLAFLIAVPGLFTPNPGAVGMEGKSVAARGVVRVTRHLACGVSRFGRGSPFLVPVAILPPRSSSARSSWSPCWAPWRSMPSGGAKVGRLAQLCRGDLQSALSLPSLPGGVAFRQANISTGGCLSLWPCFACSFSRIRGFSAPRRSPASDAALTRL